MTTLPGLAGWWGRQPTLDAKKTYLAHAKMKINEVHGQMLIVTCPEIPDSGLRRTSQRAFRAQHTKSRAFIFSEASFLFGDTFARKPDPVGPAGNGLIKKSDSPRIIAPQN